MEEFISNQIGHIAELVIDDDRSKSKFNRYLNTTANIIFLLVVICLLVKLTLLGKDYAMENWIGENEAIKGVVESVIKTVIVILPLVCIFLIVIRLLLELKKYLQLFQIVLIIGSIKLVVGVIEAINSNSVSDISQFAMSLFS